MCSRVVIERMRVALLPWGHGERLQSLARLHPPGFDVIIGADVVYSLQFVEPLMQTIAALLATSGDVSHLAGAGWHPLLIVKHAGQRATHDAMHEWLHWSGAAWS